VPCDDVVKTLYRLNAVPESLPSQPWSEPERFRKPADFFNILLPVENKALRERFPLPVCVRNQARSTVMSGKNWRNDDDGKQMKNEAEAGLESCLVNVEVLERL